MTAIGPGTRVKCVSHDGSVHPLCDESFPSIGSKWTVNWINQDNDQIGLAEWPDQTVEFWCGNFRPLDGDAELSILRSIALNPRGYVELPSREHAETAV